MFVPFALAAAVAAGALVYSPWPVVWMLRHGFGGESHAQIPNEECLRSRVEIRQDIQLFDGARNTGCDVYLPCARGDSKRVLPVVFWIHGGAFAAGSKSGVLPWGLSLAAHGYAVVAPDYPWVPEAPYPGQALHLLECLRRLNQAAVEGSIPLDLHRVILAGDSAGAFLAAQLALIATDESYASALGASTPLMADDVKATLLFCGPYSVGTILDSVKKPTLRYMVNRLGWAFFGTRQWRRAPLLDTTEIARHVTECFPPSFISDGNGFSFEREGRELAVMLEREGVPAESLFYPHDSLGVDEPIDHEYQMNLASPEGELAWRRAIAFLTKWCPAQSV